MTIKYLLIYLTLGYKCWNKSVFNKLKEILKYIIVKSYYIKYYML